ncbi:MAG: nitrite/sulfite reductase [Actinomycetales bacterium]
MTTTTNPPARPTRSKSNGAWLVEGTDPLNANEVFKQADHPLNVRKRIEEIYSVQGFDSIPGEDLRGRMRWWGLYTQRKQGIDGGKTATLAPEELDDRYFMMRVRVDGGALSTDQLRVIAGISTDFARDTADITDRQNIQLHWVQIEDVPKIWDRLESVGLWTQEACGDCPRVVLGSPVAGIATDEIIDPSPVIEGIKERLRSDLTLANLPRKFKTAVTGHPSLDVVHEINDVSLVGVVHPELGVGYDLWVGGGLSTVAKFAVRPNVFVTPEQAVDVWHAVVQIFRDYGYRRLRNKARMKFLLSDWGPEKFRQVMQDEYLGYELPDGVEPASPPRSGDHVGVHEQRDGRAYVGAAPVVGRVSGTTLGRLADLAEAAGSRRVRLTPYQKVLVLDVEPSAVDDLIAGLDGIGLAANPSPFRRSTMACTGLEYCKLAIVETKARAAEVITDLEARLADLDLDVPITLHLNGCPNSCARIQTADIGLKGQLVPGPDGEPTSGYQVHLGGGLARPGRPDAETGRTVRGLKVTSDELPDYVERVVRRFTEQREGGEGFASWAHRADEEALL